MTITNKLKSFWSVVKNFGRIDTYVEVKNLQDENDKLRKENQELKEKMKIDSEITFENNCYWIIKNDKKDGPFCTQCCDSDKKLIRFPVYNDRSYIHCPKCKHSVQFRPDRKKRIFHGSPENYS